MLCALLTYRDVDTTLRQLEEAFGLEVVRVAGGAEIRWGDGVAVAQRQNVRRNSTAIMRVPAGRTYKVEDPDQHHRRAVAADARVLNEPHGGSDGR